MKAQVFLELVEVMLEVQQDYFQAKRTGLLKAKDLLIQAKELERRVRAVVKEGHLEPDEPTTNMTVLDTQAEQQLRLDLEKEYADRMEEDDEEDHD